MLVGLVVISTWDNYLIVHFGGYRKMKWEVKLYVGGTVFNEEVRAVNMQDAKTTALARNPTARLIGINPIIGS